MTMATKKKIMQCLAESHVLPRPSFREVGQSGTTLYMAQLRSHIAEVSTPKLKVSVVAHRDQYQVMRPQPVRIQHR